MPTAQRDTGAGLSGHALAQPQRFRFEQLVRVMSAALGEKQVRFRNSVSVVFRPSDVEAMALQDGAADICPSFFSYLGGAGALPLVHANAIDTSEEACAWFDIHLQQPLWHFHRAWEKYRLPAIIDAARMASAVPGLHADCAVRYADPLAMRPVPAHVLEAVIADYFSVPARVEQFVPAWEPLPVLHQVRLGQGSHALGRDTMLGARYLRFDTSLHLHLGPLDPAALQDMLPGRPGAAALCCLLTRFTLPPVTLRAHLLSSAAGLPLLHLGQCEARLGLDTVLGTSAAGTRSDLGYIIPL